MAGLPFLVSCPPGQSGLTSFRGTPTSWTPATLSVMVETFTLCPLCRREIDPNSPDSVLTEKLGDRPGAQQHHDRVWTRVGYSHRQCLAGSGRYREAEHP
jgi:hypothetical protein